jgi:hypothetical protein
MNSEGTLLATASEKVKDATMYYLDINLYANLGYCYSYLFYTGCYQSLSIQTRILSSKDL